MGDSEMITVFHGGTEIIERPVCRFGRQNLDFGQGFYLTDVRDQAVQWAVRMANMRGKPPLLNRYHIDKDSILNNGRCKVFTAYDADWLNFIISCRQGGDPSKDYDYIEGGVANDRVIDTVNLYILGLMDLDTALGRLSEHRPNNQICMLSQSLPTNTLNMTTQKEYDDPVKSPVIQEIILSNRIGAIAVDLSQRLDIDPLRALMLFYESRTCRDLHNKATGLYLYGDRYIADEMMREAEM